MGLFMGSANFSSSKAYNCMIGVKIVPPHFQWVWNTSCQLKHKVFFWMVLHEKVNIRNLLRRKTFHLDTYNYVVMDCQQEETLFHLFWGCPFAAFCWNFVCPNRNVALSVLQTIEDMKQSLALLFAMDIIIPASWAIYITTNNLIIHQIPPPSFQRWKDNYLMELNLLKFRMKRKKYPTLYQSWLDSVL